MPRAAAQLDQTASLISGAQPEGLIAGPSSLYSTRAAPLSSDDGLELAPAEQQKSKPSARRRQIDRLKARKVVPDKKSLPLLQHMLPPQLARMMTAIEASSAAKKDALLVDIQREEALVTKAYVDALVRADDIQYGSGWEVSQDFADAASASYDVVGAARSDQIDPVVDERRWLEWYTNEISRALDEQAAAEAEEEAAAEASTSMVLPDDSNDIA